MAKVRRLKKGMVINMNINEFAQKVVDNVRKEIGEGYEITLREIPKNNGVILLGLIITADGQNVSPTIYMDSFKTAYEAGMPLSYIIESILEIYKKDTPQKSIDMEFFKDYEKVKGRICYRLINREKNENLLSQIPYVEFLDLAICFYYAYQGKELGDGSILIFNTHMEMWDTSASELLELARQNTPVLFPWECRSMEDVLCELMNEKTEIPEIMAKEEEAEDENADWREPLGENGGISMRILGNRSHAYGAAAILYSGVLEELANKENKNFYILPSSVHEVILLEEKENENVEALKAMIADVNDTQVEQEEILSYNLYYFNRKDNNITIF